MFRKHKEYVMNDFELLGLNITPIESAHLKLPVLGYRIKNFAYLTDVKTISDIELEKLKELDIPPKPSNKMNTSMNTFFNMCDTYNRVCFFGTLYSIQLFILFLFPSSYFVSIHQ